MQSTIVVGDIVRYQGIACYTGKNYTLHCLVVAIDDDILQGLTLTNLSMDQRVLNPSSCTIVGHVDIPNDLTEDTPLSSLPTPIQDSLTKWA
ncbi:MAG: hypothetical protein AAB839_00795 [Patescibacteria group bacterium]